MPISKLIAAVDCDDSNPKMRYLFSTILVASEYLKLVEGHSFSRSNDIGFLVRKNFIPIVGNDLRSKSTAKYLTGGNLPV